VRLRRNNVEVKEERREKKRRRNLHLYWAKGENQQQVTQRVRPLSRTKTKGRKSE
jgi:hypothetical protein